MNQGMFRKSFRVMYTFFISTGIKYMVFTCIAKYEYIFLRNMLFICLYLPGFVLLFDSTYEVVLWVWMEVYLIQGPNEKRIFPEWGGRML